MNTVDTPATLWRATAEQVGSQQGSFREQGLLGYSTTPTFKLNPPSVYALTWPSTCTLNQVITRAHRRRPLKEVFEYLGTRVQRFLRQNCYMFIHKPTRVLWTEYLGTRLVLYRVCLSLAFSLDELTVWGNCLGGLSNTHQCTVCQTAVLPLTPVLEPYRYIDTYIHRYIHTYIHTYIHSIHTYIHTYIQPIAEFKLA
jgi:hypothetical protein